MMSSILLDEEEYEDMIEQLEEFARENGIPMASGTEGKLHIAATMLAALDLSAEAIVALTRLIYNIGFRDNKFTNLPIR